VLYGRGTELAAVDAALAQARQGRGQLLLFVGEAGLGKTTLAEEATRRAVTLGFRVSWGRTWEGAGAPPGWPWTQIVRELLEEGLPLAPSEAARLASLVPDLAERGATATTDFATFDALLALIRRAARAAPRLFVLDDLHVADASTLSALHFVARSLRRLPAVIVATHREAEVRVRADLPGGLFERIAAEGTLLAPARLNPTEVAALVTEQLGRVASDSARAIHRSTEGNPLYVHEVVRLIASGRASAEDPLRRLPDGIRAAVAGHVGLLSAATRSLLGVAALFGRTFSRAGLAAVTGADPDGIEAALAEATTAGVVEPLPAGAAFTHVLIAEALTAALPPSERARLHAAIARWWQSQSSADARLHEIAHHLLEAGGDPAEAIGWARRAAGRAIQRLAFDQAAELYARALDQVPRLAEGERVAIDLLVGRSEALAKAGAFAASLALCKDAARRARAHGAADLEARAALASASFFNYFVPNPDVVALLEGALESVARAGEDAQAWRARLLAKLSCTLYPSSVPGRTLGLAHEAVAIARRTGDPDVLLDVLHDVTIDSLPESLPARDCHALARELSTLARARDQAYPLLRGQVLEVRMLLQIGEMDGVEERIRALEEDVRSGPPRERSMMCLMRAVPARLQGRFAEAEACLEQALQVGLPEDEPRHRALHAWLQAYTRGNLGDLQAARAFGDIHIPPNAALWVAAALGELAGGSALLRTAPTGDGAWPAMAAVHADACVLAGEGAQAGALYDMIGPAAGEALVLGPVVGLGPADRILGGLALLRGDRAAARTHFERAVALCERTGAIPFLARALAQLGRLVQTEDPQRAGSLLDRARLLAASVGMTTLSEEMARAPEGEALRPGPTPPSEGLELISLQRDGDEWIVSSGAASVRLRHLKGLLYLEELLRRPHREIHVAELYALGAGPAELGDAGPTLDATARGQYERRLADLEEELGEAEAFGDQERAARAEQEIDHLAEELARAVGMGGRDRRAGSLSERARINVQRRLKEVVTRAARTAPALARLLESSIRTGTYCSYRPLPTTS
jgi:tetratricopeptide (TPR) repeat protein